MSPPVSHVSRSSAGAAPARAADEADNDASSPRSPTRASVPGTPTQGGVISEDGELPGSVPRSGASSPSLPDLPLPGDGDDNQVGRVSTRCWLSAPIPHAATGPSQNSIFSNGPRSEAYPEAREARWDGGCGGIVNVGNTKKEKETRSSPTSGASSSDTTKPPRLEKIAVPRKKTSPPTSPSVSPPRKAASHGVKQTLANPDGKDSLRKLFKLPHDEKFVEEYLCALYKKILLQGRMYVFTNHVCFYSNVFGYTKKKTIALKDVTIVNRAYTAQVVFNAIEIVHKGKCEFFTSFIFPDRTYKTIIQAWRACSRYSKIFADQKTLSGAHDALFQREDEFRDFREGLGKGDARVAAMLGETPRVDDTDELVGPGGSGPHSTGSVASVNHVPGTDEARDETLDGDENGATQSNARVGEGKNIHREFPCDDVSSSSVIEEDETVETVGSGSVCKWRQRPAQRSVPFKSNSEAGHGRRASAPSLSVGRGKEPFARLDDAETTEAPETVFDTISERLSPDESDDDVPDDEAIVVSITIADELRAARGEMPPRPKNMQTLQDSVTLPCSVEHFFNLAWSDAAGENFTQKCAAERKHRDLKVMNWAPHKGYGHARDLTFVAPTNASIGPKETHCHQTQSYNAYALSGGGAVAVDTSQVQTDIPYGDYFRVETRWEVVGVGDGNRCSVWVGLRIPFQKTTMLRKVIEKSALEECSKGVAGMMDEVVRVLDLENDQGGGETGAAYEEMQEKAPPETSATRRRPTHRRQRSLADALADTVDVRRIKDLIPDGSRDVIWRMLFGNPKGTAAEGGEWGSPRLTRTDSYKKFDGAFPPAKFPPAKFPRERGFETDAFLSGERPIGWLSRVCDTTHAIVTSKRVFVVFLVVLIAVLASLARESIFADDDSARTFLFFKRNRNPHAYDAARWRRRAASLELELQALHRRAAFVAGEAAHARSALADATGAAAAETKLGGAAEPAGTKGKGGYFNR